MNHNRIPRILAIFLVIAMIVLCILLATPVRAAECRLQGKPEAEEREAAQNERRKRRMIFIRTYLEKMPTTCCECPLKVYDNGVVWRDPAGTQWGGYVCPITRQLINNTKREDFCPLEEADEHETP